ncbi:MAG: phosphomannomutase/phosphoglucomutase, partial [Patescibacteria group bacterium]
SPSLSENLIQGLISAGATVIDIGLTSTPLFNFTVASEANHDFGVMVSASHNPSQYNGFKMTDTTGLPVGRDTGMDKIKELVLQQKNPLPIDPEWQAKVLNQDFTQSYLDKIFSLVDTEKIQPLKVVIDTANAMGGLLLDKIFARLPQIKPIYLYKKLDGRFPNHEANPLKHETLSALQKAVRENGADLGVAYDGDADRIGFTDENGEVVAGDFLTALLGGRVLTRQPGSLILGDTRFSWAVPEYIKELGGRFEWGPVGHALMKKLMREKDAAFAGELSLHFYHQDLYNSESGDLTMLYLLEMLSDNKKLSELAKPLRRYHHSGEINFTVTDKEKIIQTIKDAYLSRAKNVIDIDGIRVEFDAWWFSLRSSNTEPLLRLNLEAKTAEEMKEKIEEIKKMINS